MRTIILALFLLTMQVGLAQAQTISAQTAAGLVGESVTVEAAVSEVKGFRSGRILVNLDGRYPHQQLTLDISPQNAWLFPQIESLEGATVTVSGTVFLYKGRPEIELSDPSQLAVR